jgi:hypothetical protein
MIKWLFNPFVYVAGARSLVIGWAIMLLTAFICCYSHTHFDGVIDAHTRRITPLYVYFTESFTDWACLVLLFYPACLIFSRSAIRFIDVAGTMALARWPLVFYALIGFGLSPAGIDGHSDLNTLLAHITGTMIALALIGSVFIIWMIALMYNAFAISGNIKGGKTIIVFVACLLIAEGLSKIIFHYLYLHLIQTI